MLKFSAFLLVSVLFLSACQSSVPHTTDESVHDLPDSGNTGIQTNYTADEHAHTLPHAHDDQAHGLLEAEPPVPTVDLVIREDTKSGWNLQIITENFAWSPEEASTEHSAGRGHAHLYIDGKKVNRVYGEWQHIPELTTGTHEIKVTLNANSHEDLTVNGKKISDTEIISVNAE